MELLTIFIYFLLAVLWSYILYFALTYAKTYEERDRLLYFILLVLIIDAVRTVVESSYFGISYTSRFGYLPAEIHEAMNRPGNLMIPKIFNLVSALIILFLMFRRWLPQHGTMIMQKEAESRRLEAEVQKRTRELEASNRKLIQSEQRLVDSQQMAELGEWELDVAAGTLRWSDQVYAIFEIDKRNSDVSYETFLKLIHPEDRDTVNALYTHSLDTKRPYDVIHRLLMSDGRIKYVREVCRTEFDSEGNPLVSIGTVQDITAIKEAEETMRRLKEEAERINAELLKKQNDNERITEALRQREAQLEEQNRRLKELDRMKSIFIASMSHELRTPLNSIIGFSGILSNGMVGLVEPQQLDYVRRINSTGKHLLELITEVIDISKIEAGLLEVSLENFELGEVVEEAVEIVSDESRRKGLEVVTEIGSCPPLYTDRKRLLQSLVNYMSNAVKFSERGRVTVRAAAEGGALDLSVTDTGIGIRPEEIDRLFCSFERLESHLKVKAGGAGLGLYLTKKIVEEVLGGEVYVRSEAGKGSTFGFVIPCVLQERAKE